MSGSSCNSNSKMSSGNVNQVMHQDAAASEGVSPSLSECGNEREKECVSECERESVSVVEW